MMLHVDVRIWDEESSSMIEGALTVERTDENEISLGLFDDTETVEQNELQRFWVDTAGAGRLAALLGVASLANELAAHEAAKMDARRQEES